MIWFTSDSHFSHKNILQYDNRPFNCIREHDETLIQNWNNVVKPEDTIYHLGDVAFGSSGYIHSILARLNGHKHLLWGNHDRRTLKGHLLNYFESKNNYLELKIDKQLIILCHYSFEVWNKKSHNSYHLFGHSHNKLKVLPGVLKYDVGVVGNNYTPVSYDTIKQIMNEKLLEREK